MPHFSEDPSKRANQQIELPDGRLLSFGVYGPEDGVPILINHGTPGSRIAADESFFYDLGVKVIYPERPGYGNSSPNRAGSFRSWVIDVTSLLDQLELDQVQVGGISGGGAYALACMAYAPERFSRNSLIASVAPLKHKAYLKGMTFGNKLGYWLSRNVPIMARWTSQVFAQSFRKRPQASFNQMKKQLGTFDKAVLEKAEEQGELQLFIDHVNEAYKNGVDGHVLDMKLISREWGIPFDDIKGPTIIWHGGEDVLSPVWGGRYLQQRLPNAEIHVLPEAGHLLADHGPTFFRILQATKTEH